MAHWPLEQIHYVSALLALTYQPKNRVEHREITVNNIRIVLSAYINTIAGEITFHQHFLRHKRFVSQRVGADERKSGQSR